MISAFVAARPDRASPSATAPPLFSADDYARMRRFFAGHVELEPTRLHPLPGLAATLRLGTLFVKDETGRFGLNAFKLLGARFAVEQLLADRRIASGDTLVCASEGNHGRAVARTAREVGCRARVYLAESVAGARADAIAMEGAEVVRVPGTYDDAVRKATADAEIRGWTVISDTSWKGYEQVPRLIMLGYTRMMDEIADTMGDGWTPDAVFVPGGVGGLLAAVAVWSAAHWPEPPAVVGVEPLSAACLQASARTGRPTTVSGPFTTAMGGLRCGEVSPLAFEAARPIVQAYVAIDDEWAFDAMRLLARPRGGDPAIEAGASGAAALGGLVAALRDPDGAALRDALGLGGDSTVVVIVSEGVTDPDLWSQVMATA
jgi:diaminopropionate ammonia-lyase